MSEAQLSTYEEIPYESKPLYPTHPDCLATIATLLGMRPAAVERCRVLELGCASGGNLIPMALALPQSRFVGIDLSPRQVGEGQAIIKALGLTNLDLRCQSILDVDETLGTFDYIACHGVYSWVPAAVQDKILHICQRQLALAGVAYISYNTYPGWHLRGVVREMMGYHVRRFTEPATRVQQARAFLDFMIQSVPNKDSVYHRLLKDEADMLRPTADSYVFHEHLEDANQPLYFSQFMERAAAKGLQYLGESWFHTRLDDLPAEVRDTLGALSEDLLQLEQYLDFLHNRTFRRTLLCHAAVKLDRTPAPEMLVGLHLTGLVKPLAPQPSVDSDAVEKFAVDNGTTASTTVPVMKAALCALHEAWPRSLAFVDLWRAAASRLPKQAEHDPHFQETGPARLAEAMLRCYLANLVALHVHPPKFVTQVSERPLASPLARLQASAGVERLTNLRHRLVELDDIDRVVVALLDGSRNRDALLEALVSRVADNSISVRHEGRPIDDPQRLRNFLQVALETALGRLARSALLLG